MQIATLLTVGGFHVFFAALNNDEFLTDERLARWVLILNTANATII